MIPMIKGKLTYLDNGLIVLTIYIEGVYQAAPIGWIRFESEESVQLFLDSIAESRRRTSVPDVFKEAFKEE